MEPITRKELFMAAAAGNGTAPEPITREEKFLQQIADTLQGGGGGTGGAVQSVNGKTGKVELAYNDLKDKPFGEEVGKGVIVPEIEVTATNGSGPLLLASSGTPLIENQVYTLTINDVSEDVVAKYDMGQDAVVLRNGSGVGNVIVFYNIDSYTGDLKNAYLALCLENGTYKIKVEGVKSTIKTIDPKYLPNEATVQPDWNQNDSTQPDYVKNRPFYTGDPVESEPIDFTGATWTLQDGLYLAEYMAEGSFPLSIGNAAKLIVDGTEYSGTVEDYSAIGEGMIGFGDIEGMMNGDLSSVNFLVYGAEADGQVMVAVAVKADAEPTSCTVIGITQEVKQIEPKYIPGSLLPDDAESGQMLKFNGFSWLPVSDPTEWELIYAKPVTADSTEIACKIKKAYKKILIVAAGIKVSGTAALDIYVGTTQYPATNYSTSGFCKMPSAAQKASGEATNSFLLIEKLPHQGHLCFANKTPYGNGASAYESDVLMTYNKKPSLVIENQIDSTTLYFGITGDTFTGAGSLTLYGVPE